MTEQTFFAAMAVGISPLVTLQLEFETCCSCVRQIAKEGAVACCACCDFLNGGVASAKQFPLPLRLFAGLVHIGNANIGEISKVALQYRHITGKASQAHPRGRLNCVKTSYHRMELFQAYLRSFLCKNSSHLGIPNEGFDFAVDALQQLIERAHLEASYIQLCGKKAQQDFLFAPALPVRLIAQSISLSDSIVKPDFGDQIGLPSQPKDSKSRDASNKNSYRCHEDAQDSDHDSPSVPPNDAVANTRLHARADTVPQLLQSAHSLIPLWTRGHSGMARAAEVCRA